MMLPVETCRKEKWCCVRMRFGPKICNSTHSHSVHVGDQARIKLAQVSIEGRRQSKLRDQWGKKCLENCSKISSCRFLRMHLPFHSYQQPFQGHVKGTRTVSF